MHTIQPFWGGAARVVSLLTLALATACAADAVSEVDEVQESAELGAAQQSVVGGTTATDCQWPSTVRVDPAQCTGTLIHPRVVTTAAHCMTGTTATIGFGTRGAPGGFSVTARCVAGARGSSGGNTGRDWAYCILPEDPRIAKIPPTPPLFGCEAALVKPGSSAWVVGYGSTTARGRVGVKRQVEVKINQFNKLAPGTIDVGDRQAGACHGDSGGPLYVRLVRDGVDYGLRTMGSTSGAGGPCDCTCSTTYVNIDNHVKAIEKNEGIDVTPCTDAEGNWDPSPACSGFESAPQMSTGSFPECVVARTTIPIESCGKGVPGGAPDAGSASADAGTPRADADAGDASAVPPTSARSDAGARDAGAQRDAAQPSDEPDEEGGPDERDPEGSVTTRDAGARRDAGRERPDDSSDVVEEEQVEDDEGDEEDDAERGSRDYAGTDSGCATTRGDRGAETLALLLLGLVLRRARRRAMA